MPEQTESRFGLNLLTQFILSCAFSIAVGFMNEFSGLTLVLTAVSSILWLTFSFGFLYGIFRLAGVRSPGLESFYQSFPFGMTKGTSMKAVEQEWPPQKTKTPTQPFDWHKLFSFQYLRFIGVLLIITSVFSLLFNIEWELLYKIIAAAVSGIILLGGAEWLRKKKATVSPFLAILGFALLHFAISLGFQYAQTQTWPPVLQMGDTWMYVKIALTVIFLFTLKRYPAVWLPLIYVLVGYFTPMSLQYVGASFSPIATAVFIVAMSAITLVGGNVLKRHELILANVFLANITIYTFIIPEAYNVRYLALILVIAAFAAQLVASVFASAKDQTDPVIHTANAIMAHILLVGGILFLQGYFPWIETYTGITFLVLANITLAAYLFGKHMKAHTNFVDVLFNLAVILASIGLFIQVEGPWSAVIFLAYSTAVLWLSLYRRNLRTRIYGCVLLLVSIVKLYLEFSGIFDYIWGCVAILVIGLLLVILSYKFEKIKDVMLHGMKKS